MSKRSPSFGRIRGGRERTFGSLAVEFLADGRVGAPYTAMRVSMKPNGRHEPLKHAVTAEFFLVLKGSMSARIAGRTRAFRAGDFAHLPPGTVHSFAAGRGGVEVLSFFSPALDMEAPDIRYEGPAA